MLIRQHIGKRLADYYAQPSNQVVGTIGQGNIINFRSLWGSWHWRRTYQRLNKQQEGQWLTPIELFQPYYSQILANFIVQSTKNEENDIEIVELGGGRGTNTYHLLTYLFEYHKQIYDRISTYTIIDSSPTLHEYQKQFLLSTSTTSTLHEDKLQFILKDLVSVATQGSDDETLLLLQQPKKSTKTIFLAAELLDNLPHDKVRRCPTTRRLLQGELVPDLQEQDDGNDVWRETYSPLTDLLLKQTLDLVPQYIPKGGNISTIPTWIPTIACGLIKQLTLERPNNTRLVLADFDWLPPPDLLRNNEEKQQQPRLSIPSQNEPLVTDMNKVDYECYLQSPHLCDILFPTNFELLKRFIQKTWKDTVVVEVQKQSEFLQQYGPEQVDATKGWLTGYTPLLEDFGNCSVLTAVVSNDDDEEEKEMKQMKKKKKRRVKDRK